MPNIHLPEAFLTEIALILPETEFTDFNNSYEDVVPTSIRFNPKKINEFPKDLESVPWCESGFYLPERPLFTTNIQFQAGAFYVQEASSMLIEQLIRQHIDLSKPLKVLDLCAAPGGKTTHLISLFHSDALIVANEIISNRFQILKENITRWGAINAILINRDPNFLTNYFEGFFDVILVDAPCSGEGMFRKDQVAINEWSKAHVQTCAVRQQHILSDVAKLLAKDGKLIYSTCTFNELENDHNANYIADLGLTPLDCDFSTFNTIVKRGLGYQCYPHLVKGEGFFCSIFTKDKEVEQNKTVVKTKNILTPVSKTIRLTLEKNNLFDSKFNYFTFNEIIYAIPQSFETERLAIASLCKTQAGLRIGEIKGENIIPDHALAMQKEHIIPYPSLDLTEAEALNFLRRDNQIPYFPEIKGWYLITCEGLGLGFAKFIGNRWNNYLPNELKIRNY